MRSLISKDVMKVADIQLQNIKFSVNKSSGSRSGENFAFQSVTYYSSSRSSYVDDGDLERVVLQTIAPAVRQSVFVSRPIVPARKTVDRGPVLQRFRAAPARSTVSFRASRPIATFGCQNVQTILVRDTSDERF
ncbi:hypothetical protein SK128_002578 [Halocaridina rubra]|uniref:Uncharacterized protein n=1 Tax=Halocaridina rubra TaxID=373956 RepID=A0AAN9A0I7_HALRR